MLPLFRTAIGAASILTLSTVTPVFAETGSNAALDSLLVHDDRTLNEALITLNEDLQEQYANDDLLSALYLEPARDFVDVAEAVGSIPQMRHDAADDGFGLSIYDDSTLDDSLHVFNTKVLMRGEDLFIRVAKQETAKGLTFTEVASVVDANNAISELQAEFAGTSEFGDLVYDDESLDGNIAALAMKMFEFEFREAQLAQGTLAATGGSFDAYVAALTLAH